MSGLTPEQEIVSILQTHLGYTTREQWFRLRILVPAVLAAAERRADSLWLELEAEKTCRRRDNEYLLARAERAEGVHAIGVHARKIKIESVNDMADELYTLALIRVVESREGCPCLFTTPCHPRCTCVVPGSSHGCSRCCRYGSDEQRAAAAERIAKALSLTSTTPAQATAEWRAMEQERDIWKTLAEARAQLNTAYRTGNRAVADKALIQIEGAESALAALRGDD